ncbi:MAG TPA: hypothetical protein VLA12_18605 [Planctomycetaceae bacterium]|nr:hypothetical protein [Planctomycetaceae bacterium]
MDDDILDLNDEYEVIDGNEVDEVIESLELLAQNVESESLRAILEDAAAEVHHLFYNDDSESQAA